MKTRPVVNFFQIASLVMLLVAVALLAAIATMHFAIHGAEVQVPALEGMTVADARSQTAGLGLNLDVDNRYYSGDVAAGHILTQSPAPGTVVRREWRVRVAESLGPQKVDVPDTVGKDERVAALTLRRAGLEVGATAQLPYGQGGGGNGAGAGPSGPRAGHFAAQHQPAGGGAGRRGTGRFCHARFDRPSGDERQGAVGQSGNQVGGAAVCECGGGPGIERKRASQAAGQARRGADATAGRRNPCGPEHGGEAGGGEVEKEGSGVRGQRSGIRDQGSGIRGQTVDQGLD